MVVLDSTAKSLVIYLAGAKATVDADWTVAFADTDGTTFIEESGDGTTNGTSKVTLVAAPASSHRRLVRTVTIYNADTAAITFYIAIDNGGTYRVVEKGTLNPDESTS